MPGGWINGNDYSLTTAGNHRMQKLFSGIKQFGIHAKNSQSCTEINGIYLQGVLYAWDLDFIHITH